VSLWHREHGSESSLPSSSLSLSLWSSTALVANLPPEVVAFAFGGVAFLVAFAFGGVAFGYTTWFEAGIGLWFIASDWGLGSWVMGIRG